jgi:putative ABC transport system permease protein
MIHYEPSFFSTISIRLRTAEHLSSTISEIESAWRTAVGLPFRYNFLDTTYDNLYRSEKTTGRVMTYLTVLALIIACLGLFGVVSFFVVQRKREVGIRKVFGATQFGLFQVLSNEYVLMVIAGNVVAFYPSWYLSQQWLQQFAYRVEVSWIVFATAFLASSILAISSIFYVILQTSKANPATILRNE